MNEVPIRLLREALQARLPARPSPECLDAETIAAWADDTLQPDERRAAEAHAADCVSCQALVAAMARTAPPASARSWWRRPVVGWLVPLTAAAAAVLVWTIVPRAPLVPAGTTLSRAARLEAPPAAESSVSAATPDTSVPPPAKQDTASASTGRDRSAARARPQRLASDKIKTNEPAPLTDGFSIAGDSAGAAAPPPALPTVSPISPSLSPERASAEPPPAPAAPPFVTRRPVATPLRVANAPALLFNARPPATVIVSPNSTHLWQLMPNGEIQHSTDSGLTWETQSTGVRVKLTAGASPGAAICWLVGPDGIVLLSTDGRAWRRLAFPEATDLAAVRATDDRNAAVNTSDGRTFRTTDGGRTWTR